MRGHHFHPSSTAFFIQNNYRFTKTLKIEHVRACMCVVCLLFVLSPFFPVDVSARSGPADDSVNVSNQDQEAACKGKATPLLPECSHCQHRRAPEVRSD